MTQHPVENDELLFAAEPSEKEKTGQTAPCDAPRWKVLVVDDDENVHTVTRLVLTGFLFEGRNLELLEAYSSEEGKALLGEHPDTAVILLDVVMERDDSGLALVRHIREVMENRVVRIVLRTGFPGMAPPSQVIIDYDINDYADKSELTAQRLVTMLVSSLRSYRDLTASLNLACRLGEEVVERKQAEMKLRASEEMYSAIFTHIGIGITMLSPDMEIIFMNPIMEAFNPHIDLSTHPICYKSFNTPPRDEICSYCPAVKTLADGRIHTAVTDTPTPEGIRNYRLISTPVLSPDGVISGVIEVAEDITEHKRSKEQLGQKEIYLQGILEATADGIMAADNMGRIIKANNKFAELWNIPPEMMEQGDEGQLLDYVLDQLLNPESFLKKVRSLYGSSKRDMDCLLFKDGRIFERYSAPLVKDNAMIGRVWSFRDITDKRKMEEEIVKAQKLESVGLLAGGIAHDFNNLLTVVLGNISLAKALLPEEDRKKGLLSEAEKAAHRARELTQQLLTFARGGAPVRRPASIAELIRETAGFALSGSRVRCDLEIDPELPPVEIDEGQISQVVHNLIINADQSMPVGGTVRISCSVANIAPDDAPPLSEGTYIRIEISDQGVGVPTEYLPRIFDPYFTTKEKGRGLGLASAYSIIRNHDGQISVSSQVGIGTIFTVYLPVSDMEPAAAERQSTVLEPGTGRILVMDDEEGILEIAGRILAHLGFETVFAHHGEEAVKLFTEAVAAGNPFQAAICDLTIPGGLGGKDIVRQLHAIYPEAKAVVSSGYSNDPVMSDYRAYGFCGVIVKPYRIEDVARVLAEVLGKTTYRP